MLSPFRYEDPLDPTEVVGRERETTELVERATAGRNTRLVAPRRYGKTSLANAAVAMVNEAGGTGVLVDLYGVMTAGEVAARLSRAIEPSLPRKLARAMRGRGLDVSVNLGPIALTRQPGDRPDARTALLELLDLVARTRRDTSRPTMVVFDEFQAVLTADPSLDATIRSAIQHHRDVGYVFAGSHFGLMGDLFNNPGRPFYAQAGALELSPLPRIALAAAVSGRFETANRDVGDALDPLLDLARGHPQRAMQMAHHLFVMTADGTSADALAAREAFSAASREADPELRAVWEGLARGQQAVLSALAHGVGPTSAQALREHGTSKGAAGPAVRELTDRAILSEDRGIVDPLLEAWIRRLRGGRRVGS